MVLCWFDPRVWYRRIRRQLRACCLFVVLIMLLAVCMALGMGSLIAKKAGAQAPAAAAPQPAVSLVLAIDNSNSMFEKSGMGSDPDLMRIEAARLLITCLGVDGDLGQAHHLGVVFFGNDAQVVAPLAALGTDDQRRQAVDSLAAPPRMGWTNPRAALDQAVAMLAAQPSPWPAILLLTDGKPERSFDATAEEKQALINELELVGRDLATRGITLLVVLLENEAMVADPDIEEIYAPLWQQLAHMTPGGRLYRVRRPEDLLDTYHEIVVALTGRQTQGVVVRAAVAGETWQQIPLEANLAHVKFVIRKSTPAMAVNLYRPDGAVLSQSDVAVRYAGQPGMGLEEVWSIDGPQPGVWQVHLAGWGTVIVWKDFYPLPVTATPTALPSVTLTPTNPYTPTSSPTATPTATASAPGLAASSQPPANQGVMPASIPGPLANSMDERQRLSLWWLLVPGSLFAAGALAAWRRYRRSLPTVSGRLRLLAAPANSTVAPRIDLQALRKRNVKLGPGAGVDIRLPAATEVPGPMVTIAAHRERLGPTRIELVPLDTTQTQVLINGTPILERRRLSDGDVIILGGYQFRYENILCRAVRGYERLEEVRVQ